MLSLRDFIRERMQELLNEHNGLIFGHNLIDVGWVAGTIPALPNHPNYVDLPISDIAGVGLAVGSALGNRPVVFISRYHGYLWLNLAPIATYAATSHRVFRQDCWFMIRAIADDGAFGPVASGSLINVAVQIKELTVCAPTNVKDWQEVWEYFLTNKSPIFVAEHRNSYSQNDLAIMNSSTDNVVLISIGGTSILLPEVQSQLREHGIFASTYNILWLKPLKLTDSVKSHLTNAEHVVILDPGTKDYGVAAGIVHALGISSKSTILASSDSYPGYAEMLRSGVGDAQRITRTIIELINGRDR